jgi:hypothetical protein
MEKRNALVLLLGFAFAALVAAETNRELLNSWIGHHYTELGSNISGKVSYNGNSVTYDSSWTEVKMQYVPGSGGASAVLGQGTIGEYRPPRSVPYEIYHERWVTFYFDANGIITTWRSYGWAMD